MHLTEESVATPVIMFDVVVGLNIIFLSAFVIKVLNQLI